MRRPILTLIILALAIPAASSATQRAAPKTVPLTVTISGSGTLRVSGVKRALSCKTVACANTFRLRVGSRVTLTAIGARSWKLTKWTGACHGATATCKLKITRSAHVAATFVPPGARVNPIEPGQAGVLGNGWNLTVNSVTPDANELVLAYHDPGGYVNKPPPPGAQDFMAQITLTYTGGGKSNAFDKVLDTLQAEGSHNAPYAYYSCGVPPAPNFESVSGDLFSGQSITGNVCFQIAINDADSLLAYVDAPQQVWFALGLRPSDAPPVPYPRRGPILVLARDGAAEQNLVWKDTALVRTGETVDILLDVTNPGVWMAHCHIAEHHESGMMFSFNVAPADGD